MSAYVTGDNNLVLSDGTFDYLYDAEGNRISRTRISNDPADDKTVEYEWDHRNRLTAVFFKNNQGSTTAAVLYQYDVFNRRTQKIIDRDGIGEQLAQQIDFIYDGQNIILALDGEGSLTNRYLHGPAVDQILADEQIGGAGVLWTLTDNQGSVRDVVTNAGTVASHIDYTAFGRVETETGPTTRTLYGWTGRERDTETGLNYHRARYYDPVIGRWISEDPKGFAAKDTSLGRYTGNDPVNYVDSDGRERRMSGTYVVQGKGHHKMPVELWEEFGFADEAKAIFDAATVGTGTKGHNRRAHGDYGYTGQVRAELHNKLAEYMDRVGSNGCLTIQQQEEFAREFIKHIDSGSNAFIKGFNEAAIDGPDAVKAWYKKTGQYLPETKALRAAGRIKGITKILSVGADVAHWVRRIPGAKYTLSAVIWAAVYNNARADGLTPAQASAIASAEAVNPLPLGPEDLRQVGEWHDRCMDGAKLRGDGLTPVDDSEGPLPSGMSRLRRMQRELLDETAGESSRRVGDAP